MIDLKGLVFLAFTGLGALFGVLFSLPLLAAGTLIPAVFDWAFVPVIVGTVVGAVIGAIGEANQ